MLLLERALPRGGGGSIGIFGSSLQLLIWYLTQQRFYDKFGLCANVFLLPGTRSSVAVLLECSLPPKMGG